MVVLSVFILTVYSLLIINLVRGFNRLPEFTPEQKTTQNNFSIIVPFRNEAMNLPALLQSFSRMNYPTEQFEIILVNDDSSDNFMKILEDFKLENSKIQITILNNQYKSNAPKKDAVQTAISKAKFDWIVTTDADCEVPVNWLKQLDAFLQIEDVKMIVAPVAYSIENKFLQHFQNLDFLSLQGTTMGSFGINRPFMCNGANLCYAKQSFNEVNGFDGNSHIASGDDVFLMEKMIALYPSQVKYLKSLDAIVKTKPQPDWKALIHQRVRWAAKMGSSKNIFGKLIGISVLLTNFFLLLLFLLAAFRQISWQYPGLFFLVKMNVDFVLLFKTSDFFKQQESMRSYLGSSLLYPLFSVYVVIISLFKGYQWKGRVFKK